LQHGSSLGSLVGARIVWKVGIEAAYLSGGGGLLHGGDRQGGERGDRALKFWSRCRAEREGDRAGKLREASWNLEITEQEGGSRTD
jgi:hypothetical protein